jgi:hypothetical protein
MPVAYGCLDVHELCQTCQSARGSKCTGDENTSNKQALQEKNLNSIDHYYQSKDFSTNKLRAAFSKMQLSVL